MDLATAISIAVGVIAILAGIHAFISRVYLSPIQEELHLVVSQLGVVQSDIESIKKGQNDLVVLANITQNSTKSAHKRIDEVQSLYSELQHAHNATVYKHSI